MDITVIIPTYNRAWAIERAIDSCKSESVSVQVIVMDDGSTDDTLDILKNKPGIEYYTQQHWGKPWAVNLAFEHAKGKYIKFLDSDDWLLPNSLEKQFILAEKEQADLVVAGYDLYEGENYLRTLAWTNCDDFIAQNLGECDSSHYTAFLFKKCFINDIPHRTSFAAANFASRDDRCFMLEVSLKEPKVAVMEGSAFCHTYHQRGRLQFQSGLRSACTNYQHLLIYKNIIRQLADSDRLTDRRINAAVKVLWPLCHWIAKDDLQEAVGAFNWLLELAPAFKIPSNGMSGFLYKNLGFKGTERLLRLRRAIVHG